MAHQSEQRGGAKITVALIGVIEQAYDTKQKRQTEQRRAIDGGAVKVVPVVGIFDSRSARPALFPSAFLHRN